MTESSGGEVKFLWSSLVLRLKYLAFNLDQQFPRL